MRARDVVAFGRETGRVLSDGRIIGRAEPFAEVFASSRDVKRAVGATPWVILEDIALDAAIDDRGREVAETSVRQIAANLGLNKTTIARHVARLRGHGFLIHEEARDDASGGPLARVPVRAGPIGVCRAVHPHPHHVEPPLPSSVERDEPIDRADGTVSAFTGHGRSHTDPRPAAPCRRPRPPGASGAAKPPAGRLDRGGLRGAD